MALATMIWMMLGRSRRHKKYADYVSISSVSIRNAFGRNPEFKDFIVESPYFLVTGFNNGDENYTRGYKLTEAIHEKAIASYLKDYDLPSTEMLDISGKKAVPTRAAIDSRTMTGKHYFWKGCSPAKRVPVNLDALQSFRRTLRQAINATDDRHVAAKLVEIDQCASAIFIASNTSGHDKGFMPVRYKQAESGRLYAIDLSLQSSFRWVRRAALAGQWDYDISNAHFAILDNLAAKVGYQCLQIRDYLDRKREIREELSAAAGMPVDLIKQVLIALLYGAQPRYAGAIYGILGADACERLYQHPLFQSIYADTKQAFNAILTSVPSGMQVRNAIGSEIERAGEKKASLMSHLLQGYEACALRAVVRLYQEKISLCVHDGWCSTDELDMTKMKSVIQTATEFDLDIEKELLTVPTLDEMLPVRNQSRAR